MKYTELGKTGIKISVMGFGGIPIQKLSPDDMPALFDAMEELGINFIDSARGYSVSEEYIGIGISGRRDKFVLATKSMSRDKASMAADIEKSLSNFKTDYIDLYQIHNPTPDQLRAVCAPGGALEALFEARAAGKIGHIGLTGHTLEIFDMALGLDWVETFMFPYNIVETQCESRLSALRAQGKAFICMKPLAGGAIENGRAAMRFIAANENVTVVIPGIATASELSENTAAYLDPAPLSGEEKAEFETVRAQLGTVFCRRCGYCAPCTVGINIPVMFTLAGYLERYGLAPWARERYAAQKATAADCIGCGACEERCPYDLPIVSLLKKVSEEFR
ncbi:MAG: aldo/keto reductase [Ruminococcaceae bacterium]|nr:aldo/keto reductase [Oscillospiraceae bacterium]